MARKKNSTTSTSTPDDQAEDASLSPVEDGDTPPSDDAIEAQGEGLIETADDPAEAPEDADPISSDATDTTLDDAHDTTVQDDLHDDLAQDDPGQEVAAHQDELEAEGGSSLASRVLTWLVLLLAGGGIALWGAPKVAPELPSGLGPVKTWLMPGESAARQDIAALRAEMEAQLAALAEQQTPDTALEELRTDLSGEIETATSGLATQVDDKIASLSTSLSETIGTDFGERLSTLETEVAGVEAELEALMTSLTGLEADGAQSELSEETLAQIAGFAAVVEGLKAEVGALAEREGAINTRIDQVAALAETRIVEAEDAASEADEAAAAALAAAATTAALARVDALAREGAPFADALAELAEASGTPAPDALSAVADSGIPSAVSLRTSFGDLAGEAVKASVRETASEDGGVGARLGAFLSSQVATRALEPQEGDSANAVLSRAQAAVDAEDFAAALAEVSTLSGAAAQTIAPWVDMAQSRLSALDALDGLSATLSPSN